MSIRRKVVSALSALISALGIVAVVLPAGPAHAANIFVQNNWTWNYLYAPGGVNSSVVGSRSHQTTWVTEYRYTDEVRAYYRLRVYGTNLCLVVRGSANDAGAVLYTCGSWADQHWGRRYIENNVYQLINANSGKCLVNRADSTAIVQIGCNTNWEDQFWYLPTW